MSKEQDRKSLNSENDDFLALLLMFYETQLTKKDGLIQYKKYEWINDDFINKNFDEKLNIVTKEIQKKLACCYLLIEKEINSINQPDDEKLPDYLIENFKKNDINRNKLLTKQNISKLFKSSLNKNYYIIKLSTNSLATDISKNDIISITETNSKTSLTATNNKILFKENKVHYYNRSERYPHYDLTEQLNIVKKQIERLQKVYFGKNLAGAKIDGLKILADHLKKLPFHATQEQIKNVILLWGLRGDFINSKTNKVENNITLIAKNRLGFFKTSTQKGITEMLDAVEDSADIVTNKKYRTNSSASAA